MVLACMPNDPPDGVGGESTGDMEDRRYLKADLLLGAVVIGWSQTFLAGYFTPSLLQHLLRGPDQTHSDEGLIEQGHKGEEYTVAFGKKRSLTTSD